MIIFSLNVLKVDVILFLFKMFFKGFISKLFSFDSFLAIDLRDRITANKILNQQKRKIFRCRYFVIIIFTSFKNKQHLIFKYIKNNFIFVYL